MIEDDVQNDAHADRVRGTHQLDEIGPSAEAGIHLEKILHPVAVEIVAFHTLSEHRGDPERGDPEIRQVTEAGS